MGGAIPEQTDVVGRYVPMYRRSGGDFLVIFICMAGGRYCYYY